MKVSRLGKIAIAVGILIAVLGIAGFLLVLVALTRMSALGLVG